jgi:hypothetical protein
MLNRNHYIFLITKHYYKGLHYMPNKIKATAFINFSYTLDNKKLYLYQSYIYFLLTIFLGQCASFLILHKTFRRFNVRRGQPLGILLNISNMDNLNYFLILFNKWYYYTIFGELKGFLFNKKLGGFFGLKIPFLNLFYNFDYNIITFLIFNLSIPNFKLIFSGSFDKYESKTLKNVFGFFQ